MMTGHELANWITDLRTTGRSASGAAVFGHGACLCDQSGEFLAAVETAGDGVAVLRDDLGAPAVPAPVDWLFAHPDVVSRGDEASCVRIDRDRTGEVRVRVERRGHGDVSIEGAPAVRLVEYAGYVARLAVAGAALAAVGDTVATDIERVAADASSGFRARHDGLRATNRFFAYAAALACFLAACERVAQRREPPTVVAATELLVAGLLDSGSVVAYGMDPAWAQAELAASYA